MDEGLLVYKRPLFMKENENMKSNCPTLYYIDGNYLKAMHKVDYRVSVKYNNRAFVGIITTIGTQKYVIPLTSQTTQERKKEGKNKRNGKFTAFVTESSGVEIANILFNNMLPVFEDVITPLNIDPTVDTYESNEIRYIRKHWDAIQTKAKKVYDTRYDTNSRDYDFFVKTCCDFKKLEDECAKLQLSSGI